jgi:hypothetical protein
LAGLKIMMGHQVEQAALFYEFSLEKHIPADHLMRSIDRFVDLEQVRRDLAQFILAATAQNLRKLAKLIPIPTLRPT